MKKILVCIGIIILCIAAAIPVAVAQNETSSTIRGEIAGDRQAIRSEAQDIKEDASAAKQEEKQLKDQILAAEQSGDMETARNLRDQLKAMHRENVRDRQQDKKEMKDARQELRQDIKEARQERNLPPRRDRDNIPPGPRGGAGTNWENPPGPAGGPGASPNRGGGGRRR